MAGHFGGSTIRPGGSHHVGVLASQGLGNGEAIRHSVTIPTVLSSRSRWKLGPSASWRVRGVLRRRGERVRDGADAVGGCQIVQPSDLALSGGRVGIGIQSR